MAAAEGTPRPTPKTLESSDTPLLPSHMRTDYRMNRRDLLGAKKFLDAATVDGKLSSGLAIELELLVQGQEPYVARRENTRRKLLIGGIAAGVGVVVFGGSAKLIADANSPEAREQAEAEKKAREAQERLDKKAWEAGHTLTEKPSIASADGWTIRAVAPEKVPPQLKPVTVERTESASDHDISLGFKNFFTGRGVSIQLSEYQRSDKVYTPKLTVINRWKSRGVSALTEDWILGDPDETKTWQPVLFEQTNNGKKIQRYVTIRKVSIDRNGKPSSFYEVTGHEPIK